MFSAPKLPDPQPAPKVPTAADPSVAEAERRELAANRNLRGRQATLLASTNPANNTTLGGGRATLLGQ